MCHCGNTGVERILNESQHTKLTLERKCLLPGFELATFRSRVLCSYQKAILCVWLHQNAQAWTQYIYVEKLL